MSDHNRIIFDCVRPWLDSAGFNKPGRVDALNAACAEFAKALAGPGVAAGAETVTRPLPVPAPPASGVVALISPAILRAACPERTLEQLEPWVAPIQAACQRFEINTIRRVAAFVSQMAHESGLKPGREEDLSYRAARLVEVWPNRFPNIAVATPYAHNPEKLANNTYANRMGNGDEASGDGWKFRGAGPGQLTGKDNWTGFAKDMGLSVDEALSYGRTLEGGVMSFAWFWEENDINRFADTPGVNDETRRINGGEHGLADRKARFDRTVAALLAAGG